MMVGHVCLYPITTILPLPLFLCQIFISSPPYRSCGKWLSSRWWAVCPCTSSSTCADASLHPITPSWPLKPRSPPRGLRICFLWENTKIFLSLNCKPCTLTRESNTDKRPLIFSEKLLLEMSNVDWIDRDRLFTGWESLCQFKKLCYLPCIFMKGHWLIVIVKSTCNKLWDGLDWPAWTCFSCPVSMKNIPNINIPETF